MRIAVVGDSMLDVEVAGEIDGDCPENRAIALFKGPRVNIYAGGAGNVATILTEAGATVDLYADGPGLGPKAWIGELFKQVVRCNRIYWSGEGNLPLKMRGVTDNQVRLRIDAEEFNGHTRPFVPLKNIAEQRTSYEVILVSDYCKGMVNPNSEEYIRAIIRRCPVVVIDSKRKDYSLWSGATALTPNRDEAAAIYSTSSPSEIRAMLGAQCVYITRGNQSVSASFDGNDIEIEVTPVADPYVIGAGDAFAAGVALGLGKGASFLEAGINGVSLASKYVARPRRCLLR